MKPIVTMREALSDPALLGTVLPGPTWLPWRALLIATMGEELTDEEREAFQRFTGRAGEPLQRAEEFWGVIGRRGGKTRAASALVVYVACLCDHSDNLAVGERGLALFLAQNQKQAGVAFNYAAGIFDTVPMLGGMVTNRTADTIALSNSIDLEIRASNFRGLRGVTCVIVIGDEAAFWYSDETSANADKEVLDAVRPALATTGGLLAVFSSPYARRGEVWATHRRHFGPDGDPRVIVAQGTSRDLNPSLAQSIVDRAIERDPAAASAEWLAQFRSDLEQFVSRETVDAATVPGRHMLPPVKGVTYFGFTDPSGGAQDSFTLAISHAEEGRGILDLVRECKPPFSPDLVTEEFCGLLRAYGLAVVTGDAYGGDWPRSRFRAHGVEYLVADKPKSDLYRNLLPALNSGNVELLDNQRLANQLCGLQRRTARGGRDSIDHPPGQHDDLINAAAGALDLACPNVSETSGWGVMQFYKQEAAKIDTAAIPVPEFGWSMGPPAQLAPPAGYAKPSAKGPVEGGSVPHALGLAAVANKVNVVRVRPPAPGISQLNGASGESYLPASDGSFVVDRLTAAALVKPPFGDRVPWAEVTA
jgi:hypothetical protein